MNWTLRKLRENYNLTTKEVANQVGIDQKLLEKYERDSSKIPIDFAQRLATFYKLPLDDIFLGDEYDLKRIARKYVPLHE